MPEAAQITNGKASPAQPGVFVDPFRSYNFKLSIGGVSEGYFTQCSGLEVKVEAIQYRQGGLNQVVHWIPGRVSVGRVRLDYGLTRSVDLYNWFQAVMDGKGLRRHASVILLDSDGITETVRWDLLNAWPSEWRGAVLDALSNEVAIESLTLVYETLKRG
jgi:phage tail-like protein